MPFPTSSFVRSGKYMLLQQQPVGSGGLGQVYRAREVALGREVAVKAVAPGLGTEQRDVAVEKLLHEASIHGGLRHPAIVAAHTLESDPLTGEPYLVSDFVAGGSLADYLKEGPLAEGEAIALTLDLLGALEYLHSQGVVHRDIKPSNVLLHLDRGGERRALLADFGIARRLKDAPSTLGAGDSPSLTPEYCAPEQRDPSQLPDPRTDLYSVGLLLGELLVGGGPYKLQLRARSRRRWARWQGSRHQQIAPHTSRRLAAAIDRATEEEPARRFQTPAAFAAALRPLVRRQRVAPSRPAPSRLGLVMASLSVVLLAALLPLGLGSRLAVPTPPAPTLAAAVILLATATAPPLPSATDLAPSPAPAATVRPTSMLPPSATASPAAPTAAPTAPPPAASAAAPSAIAAAPQLAGQPQPPLEATAPPRVVVRPVPPVRPSLPGIANPQPPPAGVVPW